MGDSGRRAVFDTLKGIGIVEVVTHHCLGYSMRKFAEEHNPAWWAMWLPNRILHFAIPLFLLVSAALLTQSLVKRMDWKRFALRRAARTLWPFLLWSGIYVLVRLYYLKVGDDIEVISANVPIVGTLTGPRLLVDWWNLAYQLAWGKLFYHLYFMVVLLQLALALPLALLLLRRFPMSLGRVLVLAALLQLAMFLLQRWVLVMPAPASTILWYVPSLLVGVWIGMNPETWREEYSRRRVAIWSAAGVGLALYLGMNLSFALGRGGNSLAYNSAFTVFTVATALGLFGVAPSLSDSKAGRVLSVFGRVSLPMFLIHPMILVFLGGPTISSFLAKLPLPAIWIICLVLAVSYGLARLAMLLRLDLVLFGQKLPRVEKPLAQA